MQSASYCFFPPFRQSVCYRVHLHDCSVTTVPHCMRSRFNRTCTSKRSSYFFASLVCEFGFSAMKEAKKERQSALETTQLDALLRILLLGPKDPNSWKTEQGSNAAFVATARKAYFGKVSSIAASRMPQSKLGIVKRTTTANRPVVVCGPYKWRLSNTAFPQQTATTMPMLPSRSPWWVCGGDTDARHLPISASSINRKQSKNSRKQLVLF